MNWAALAGLGVTAVGVAGYAVGTQVAYPGRALSITAVILGIGLVAVSGRPASRGEA